MALFVTCCTDATYSLFTKPLGRVATAVADAVVVNNAVPNTTATYSDCSARATFLPRSLYSFRAVNRLSALCKILTGVTEEADKRGGTSAKPSAMGILPVR